MPRRSPSRSKSRAGPLTQRQYQKLLDELHQLLEQGRRRGEEAQGRQLVQAYHAVGKRLLAQKLTGNAGYGTATLQRLADDLEVKVRNLQRAMAFARAYPKGPPDSGLRWSHYRELLRLPDAGQRGWYEEQAAAQRWPVPKLLEAVRDQQYRNRDDGEPTGAKRKPHTSRKPRKQLPRPTASRYGYQATIERVIDGDTLLAVIDLGFQVRKEQRLRLAGIDAPELGTAKADRAFQLVQDELARVEYVMLKTDKIDLYGRYVAHVFYAPGETDKQRVFTEGTYLNQRLVDEGLARVM